MASPSAHRLSRGLLDKVEMCRHLEFHLRVCRDTELHASICRCIQRYETVPWSIQGHAQACTGTPKVVQCHRAATTAGPHAHQEEPRTAQKIYDMIEGKRR